MKDPWRILLLALTLCSGVAFAQATTPSPAPESTHHRDSDWLNSPPLTLAALKGEVVLVEFYLIGRDGKLCGHACGEMHVGQDSAKRVEQAQDLLLNAASRPA